jgi:hypothetical protein
VTRPFADRGIVEVQTPRPAPDETPMSSTRPAVSDDQSVYRITVAGRVGEDWGRWFDAEAVRPGEDRSEIVVRVADQADLLGRLRRVHDLNLHLVEVVMLAPANHEEADQTPLSGRPTSHSDR